MRRTENIVLTGFMGTGKSTVGRLLAQRLGYEFVDTDAVIEARHGPIPTIFRDHGEARFRLIEQQVAAELGGRSRLVIATGGRMMLDPTNVSSLTANGRVFCLVATAEEILQRVTSDDTLSDRPLLDVPDPRRRIRELLEERDPLYRRFPQLTTTGRSPRAVTDAIIELLGSDRPPSAPS